MTEEKADEAKPDDSKPAKKGGAEADVDPFGDAAPSPPAKKAAAGVKAGKAKAAEPPESEDPFGDDPGQGSSDKKAPAAKKAPETLKAFLNTVLAELWAERGSAPDWEKVYLRREQYELGIVPVTGLFLVAGVDIQDRELRIEAQGSEERGVLSGNQELVNGEKLKDCIPIEVGFGY